MSSNKLEWTKDLLYRKTLQARESIERRREASASSSATDDASECEPSTKDIAEFAKNVIHQGSRHDN